jgi:hypothetical protein
MHENSSLLGGTLKPHIIEGRKAADNFERGMKKLFQVPKSEVEKAERKYKAGRKRKKANASRVPGACD